MSELIFAAEDDPSIRELVRCLLAGNGYRAVCFETGEELLIQLKNCIPDLFILDIMLPGMNGMELLSKLRQEPATKEVPVILLTAKTSELDKVEGLDSGANDYISKPFGVLEFMARVRAVLRGTSKKLGTVLAAGDIRMDTERHTVTANGSPVILTLKEYELLRLLLSSPGKVVPRSELLSEVWGMDFTGETRTLDMHIGTLRSKLGDDPDHPRYIETVRGVGYRLISELVT